MVDIRSAVIELNDAVVVGRALAAMRKRPSPIRV